MPDLGTDPDLPTLTDMLPLDYGDLDGGLVRMMERHRTDGTLTGDVEADAFLRASPEAVLLGLLFDQRVRAESAFTGPERVRCAGTRGDSCGGRAPVVGVSSAAGQHDLTGIGGVLRPNGGRSSPRRS